MTTAAALPPAERKRRNRVLHGEDIAARRERFASRPVMVQIEPTNRCNLSCAICARNFYDPEKNAPGEMGPEVLALAAPLFADAEDVVIGGYGEPLLAGIYWDALESAKRAGCRVETITNGTLLSEDAAVRLAGLGLDRLVVSLDGATEKTMREIRGAPLSGVVDNLMGLAEVKRRGRTIFPEVAVNFTASRANVHELAALVDVAESFGARRIQVALQKVYTPDQRDRTLLLEPSRARRHFDEARDTARARGIEIALPSLDGEARECRQPLDLLFVRHNGQVLGCCSAVFENDRYNFPLGDLRGSDVEALWNGPEMRRYRRALFAGDDDALPAPCRNCAFRRDDLAAQYRFLAPEETGPEKVDG
jgi:Fe-coproporphyrin III synthase